MLATLVAGGPIAADPARADPAQRAQALAERAFTHTLAVGREQAFVDFSRVDGPFTDGDLYIFCVDASGVILANGGNPRVVGHNMADLRGPDWKMTAATMTKLDRTDGAGWIEFRWPNPATKRVELKAAYVLKIDDHTVCGSGYYKGAPP